MSGRKRAREAESTATAPSSSSFERLKSILQQPAAFGTPSPLGNPFGLDEVSEKLYPRALVEQDALVVTYLEKIANNLEAIQEDLHSLAKHTKKQKKVQAEHENKQKDVPSKKQKEVPSKKQKK